MKNELSATDLGMLPQIDLNEERRRERQGTFVRSRRSALAIGILLALSLVVLIPFTVQAIALRAQVQNTERQRIGLKNRLAALTDADSQLDTRISGWSQVVQSRQARQAWSDLLPSLAACLPGNVTLEQVQAADQGKSAEIELHGSAETMKGLHAFAVALSNSALFAHVRLNETTANSANGVHTVSFQMAGPVTLAANSNVNAL